MATYYVGPGGNDGNSGTSWGNRKLTLNGAEDIPVAANDTVYVGPGVYRETLTVDISGTAGNIITYIADVTGQNTDGVGGAVRITGSNNDLTAARSSCITMVSRNYRTFRGFMMDTSSSNDLIGTSCGNIIIEDCDFQPNGTVAIQIAGGSQSNWTIRRCTIRGGPTGGTAVGQIQFTDTSTVDNAGHLIQNCQITASNGPAVISTRVGGITIRNCLLFGCEYGVRIVTALSAGQTVTVNNSIISNCNQGFRGLSVGEITEDYNLLHACVTNHNTVTAGSNTIVNSSPLFIPKLLFSGIKYSLFDQELSLWSTVGAKLGTSQPSVDIYGITRPTTSAKNSWGPFQFDSFIRETTTTRTGGVSMKMPDANRHQMFVPTTNTSTTISVYAYREANYAGTNPQMIIRQPGQADRTTTDAGSASTWNQLTDTFTPAANPPYVVVLLASNNTATSGSYATYFDDLSVT